MKPLRETDRAIRAIADMAVTVTEDQGLDHARDQMFRLGVPALLVARDGLVAGVVTEQAARSSRRHGGRAVDKNCIEGNGPHSPKVADVMIPVDQIPSIDWEAVENAQVRDLVRMLEGRGTKLLLVVLRVTPTSSIIRGLIHRDRIQQQLGASWIGRWPSWMHQRAKR